MGSGCYGVANAHVPKVDQASIIQHTSLVVIPRYIIWVLHQFHPESLSLRTEPNLFFITSPWRARWPDAPMFFQYLAIYNDEFLPKSIQKIPKWVHNFTKYQINLWNVAKYFLIFAKLAKFRQIWSHCWSVRENVALGKRH